MSYERTHLKNIRILRGYTQQEVADKLGVTKATISKYEKGQRKINHAEQLAELYGVDLSYIYLGKNMDELRKELRNDNEIAVSVKENEPSISQVSNNTENAMCQYVEFVRTHPYLMSLVEDIGLRIVFENIASGRVTLRLGTTQKQIGLSELVHDLESMYSKQKEDLRDMILECYELNSCQEFTAEEV